MSYRWLRDEVVCAEFLRSVLLCSFFPLFLRLVLYYFIILFFLGCVPLGERLLLQLHTRIRPGTRAPSLPQRIWRKQCRRRWRPEIITKPTAKQTGFIWVQLKFLVFFFKLFFSSFIIFICISLFLFKRFSFVLFLFHLLLLLLLKPSFSCWALLPRLRILQYTEGNCSTNWMV